jgi:hypothetical protein
MREKSMRRHGSNDVNFHNGRFRSLDLISLVLNTGPVCWDTDEFALEDSDKIRILKVWFRDDQPGIAIGIHVPSLGIEGKDQGGKVNGKVEVEGTSNLNGVRIRDDDGDDDDDDQIVNSNSHVQRTSKKRSINDANDDNEVESQKPSGKRKADGVEETIRQTAQDQIEGEEPEQLQFQLPRKKGDEPNKDKLHERGEKVQSDSNLSKSASPASESSASSSPQTSLSNVSRDFGATFDSMAISSHDVDDVNAVASVGTNSSSSSDSNSSDSSSSDSSSDSSSSDGAISQDPLMDTKGGY